MGTHPPPQSLFAALRDGGPDLPWTRRFLAGIAGLPPDARGELPVLADIAALCAAAVPAGRESWGPVLRGLDRRYLRVRFVQGELERLDFRKAGEDAAFNDFVFDQIDFTAYREIADEQFALFSGEGIGDFEGAFLERAFHLDGEKIKTLIAGAYTRAGGFYHIKREGLLSDPLLMSLLRTLQTSLSFAPLFTADAVLGECRRLSGFPADGRLYDSLLKAAHGAAFVHADGMRTELAAVQEEGALTLRGVFHPCGKAYTITLAA
jgi:hypothetical protein